MNKCPPPNAISNATVSVGSLIYGGLAMYSCIYSYHYEIGNATLTCNGNEWMGQPIICKGQKKLYTINFKTHNSLLIFIMK